MAIISLSGRTWVGNDTIDQMLKNPLTTSGGGSLEYAVDFECDGVAYTSMVVNKGSYNSISQHPFAYVESDGSSVTAATGTKWNKTKYKTLTFPEGGNGHTNFGLIYFLHKNGKFTPDIEEMKDGKLVTFSVTGFGSSKGGASPRLIIYPYSNDTKETLGTYIIDQAHLIDGEVLEIPCYKDIIYSLRIPNTDLNGAIAPSINGQVLQGFSGATLAVNNCHRLTGGETLVLDKANYSYTSDGSATALRWAIGLEGGTPAVITYNGTETTLENGKTATLACKGKKATSNIVVKFGSDGGITYGGSTTDVEGGKTATLQCAGKKMTSDVYITTKQ